MKEIHVPPPPTGLALLLEELDAAARRRMDGGIADLDDAGLMLAARLALEAQRNEIARLVTSYDRMSSGADERDEGDTPTAVQTPAAGARCRHEWTTREGVTLCDLCGKAKGKQGRKAKSPTVVDPPSAPLPGVVPGNYVAPPVEAERGTLRTVGAVAADKFADGGMGSSGRGGR